MTLRLKFDERKATQVAARFLAAAGGTLPYMSLIKLMYFMDREALFQWGAPVTNDTYFSLDHGPILRIAHFVASDMRAYRRYEGMNALTYITNLRMIARTRT